jgi:phosphohistidine phosphatase SixA
MSERLRLLLLRHGTAVTGSADPGLSAEGRSGVEATLRHPRLADWSRLDLLLHSPLRRAVETAELVAARLAPIRVRAAPEFLPEADAAAASRLLIRSLAGPDTHAAPDIHVVPKTHKAEVPDTHQAEVPDTHGIPNEVPDTHAHLPATRVCVVAHLPLLPALCRWLCDADLDFATGCGWVLGGDPALAWQGTFSTIGPVDHGGMW